MRAGWTCGRIRDNNRTADASCQVMLILNEVEAAVLCGEKETECQIRALAKLLPETEIALTIGEAGSIIYEPGAKEILRQAAAQASPVDTTAAGDTFLGYYVSMRFNGQEVAKAAKMASIAAAKAVEVSGAAESIPRIDWRNM